MNANDAIKHTLDVSARLLTGYIEDLNDADLLIRPTTGANHIAWQIGHLISAESRMLDGIKAGSSPALPAGFIEAHKKDTAAIDDASKFFTKKQYLEFFGAQRKATLQVLATLTEKELDAPAPEKYKALASTVGTLMNALGTHVLMHVGQFVIVRRKLGKAAMF